MYRELYVRCHARYRGTSNRRRATTPRLPTYTTFHQRRPKRAQPLCSMQATQLSLLFCTFPLTHYIQYYLPGTGTYRKMVRVVLNVSSERHRNGTCTSMPQKEAAFVSAGSTIAAPWTSHHLASGNSFPLAS
jgi:hypothetical protein